MSHLAQMQELYSRYCADGSAKLLTVYIQEGILHNICLYLLFIVLFCFVASNGSGLNSHKPVGNYHKTIDDRITAARRMVSDKSFPGEVICDCIENETLLRYDAHPERILIILVSSYILYNTI